MDELYLNCLQQELSLTLKTNYITKIARIKKVVYHKYLSERHKHCPRIQKPGVRHSGTVLTKKENLCVLMLDKKR